MKGEVFTYDDSKSILADDEKDMIIAASYINDSRSTIVVIFSHKVYSRAYAVLILTISTDSSLGTLSGTIKGFEDFDCDGRFKPFDASSVEVILPDCARAEE
jgi:hypothetical protein